MLERARRRIENREEPFHRYWLLAREEADANLSKDASPYSGPDPMQFHQKAQEEGMAARLLAYRWQLDNHETSALNEKRGQARMALL